MYISSIQVREYKLLDLFVLEGKLEYIKTEQIQMRCKSCCYYPWWYWVRVENEVNLLVLKNKLFTTCVEVFGILVHKSKELTLIVQENSQC